MTKSGAQKAWWWFALLACAAGCGGAVATKPDTADAGSRSDSDASGVPNGSDAASTAPTPWSPVCPGLPPAEGAACPHGQTTYCEYGPCEASATIVVCSGGTWAGAVGVGSNALCNLGPNAASCPSAKSGIAAGTVCLAAGATCAYADGVCQCVEPQAPSPNAKSTWFCGPQPGCPMPRPRLGSACTTAGESCDYQVCGAGQVCTGGIWQPGGSGCGG